MKVQSFIVGGLMLAGAQVASVVIIGYWSLEDGPANSTATTINSSVNTADLTGTPAGFGSGAAPVFSSNIPGRVITDGLGGAVLTSNNFTSLKFTNTGGVNSNNGSVVRIQDDLSNNNLLEPTGNFTIEGFVRIDNNINFATLVSKERGGTGQNTFTIDTNSNGTLRLRVDSNSVAAVQPDIVDGNGVFNQGLTTGFSLNDGDWHHFALTYDATERRMTLFGDYIQRGTMILGDSGVLQFDDGPLLLGSLGGGRALDGMLDEIRYTGSILTTAQFLRAGPLPEPASASLLLIAAGALMRRRRLA